VDVFIILFYEEKDMSKQTQERGRDTFWGMTGVRLGRYVLGQKLGEGGMATVYKACSVDGADVAIKLRHRMGEAKSKPELTSRFAFARESALLKIFLGRQGIVQFIDHGSVSTDRGQIDYLVTEYLEGKTLAQVMQHHKDELVYRVVLMTAACVADALFIVHEARVAHLDIKPENIIFVREHGIVRLKLIDFGCGCQPMNVPRLTPPGVLLGTPTTFAPAQLVRDEDGRFKGRDHPTDIFQFGILLYQLADPELSLDVLKALIRKSDPPSLPAFPDAFSDIARACCKIDISLRPKMSEVRDKLSRLRSQHILQDFPPNFCIPLVAETCTSHVQQNGTTIPDEHTPSLHEIDS